MGKCKKKSLNSSIWTDTNVERYLKLFLANPVLWDETRCDFNSSKSKCATYEKIADELNLRGVDAVECRKVFEQLKKLYAQRHQRPDEAHPAWFGTIGKMLKKIAATKGKEKCLCGEHHNCHKHCAKQPLESACSFYHKIKSCHECCTKQDLEFTPICCPDMLPTAESVALENKYHMCEECCARQGIGAPCADFYASESSIGSRAEDDQRCERSTKGFRMEFVNVNVAVIRFDEDSENDERSIEDRQPNDTQLTICECSSGGSSSSGSLIEKFCTQGSMVLGKNDASDSESINPCDDDGGNDEQQRCDVRGGLFTDSLRFRGKPISLAGDCVEVPEPRRHFAAAIRSYDVTYPLQLDM